MSKIIIVYHSGYGHTKKLAEAVLAGTLDGGADAKLVAVSELDDAGWAELDAADALIFGAPTYMGGPSADFKKFADASSKPWVGQKWKDKVAAGFTNSATMNGDKFSTIQYFITLAMQHGMIWAGLGIMPANTKAATRNELCRRICGTVVAVARRRHARRSPRARRSRNGKSVRRAHCGRDGALEGGTAGLGV
jgi:NAD(P)H dehydrogenase (quinone)